MEKPLLQIENLTVRFDGEDRSVRAVDHVSLDVPRGGVLGLVGESGCGKSVTAMSILRLIPQPPGRIEDGRIRFDDMDLLQIPHEQLRQVRGRRISVIFQEPMTALSPLQKVVNQLREAVQLHRDVSDKEAAEMALDWMRKVGIPDAESKLNAYPFELSGGMRQRVMIAMALMLRPELIIADEPTTALDVTVQAQILDLLLEGKESHTSVLLITHDMGVIWETCDRVAVMYASRLVEEGPVKALFENPLHPYTEGLLASMPVLHGAEAERLTSIPGQVPPLGNLPAGCHFHDRCPYAFDRCRTEQPPLEALDADRRAACWLAKDRERRRGGDGRR